MTCEFKFETLQLHAGQLTRQLSRGLCQFTEQRPMCLTILRREKGRATQTGDIARITNRGTMRGGLRLWKIEVRALTTTSGMALTCSPF